MRCNSTFVISRVNASRAPNGSSIKSIAGCQWIKARTRPTRCCKPPPDNSVGIIVLKAFELRDFQSVRALGSNSMRRQALYIDRQEDVFQNSSAKEIVNGRLENYADIATRSPLSAHHAAVLYRYDAFRRPAKILSNVVLPQPDGPTIAQTRLLDGKIDIV